MERAIFVKFGTMECSLWFGRTARKYTSAWTHSKRCIDCQRNENNSRNLVSISSNIARRFRGWLHEGHRSLFTRNASSVRRSTGWNAARPSSMHLIRSRAFALSAAAHSFWSSFVTSAVAASHSTVYHRILIFQRNYWQCSDFKASRRHVHHGKI